MNMMNNGMMNPMMMQAMLQMMNQMNQPSANQSYVDPTTYDAMVRNKMREYDKFVPQAITLSQVDDVNSANGSAKKIRVTVVERNVAVPGETAQATWFEDNNSMNGVLDIILKYGAKNAQNELDFGTDGCKVDLAGLQADPQYASIVAPILCPEHAAIRTYKFSKGDCFATTPDPRQNGKSIVRTFKTKHRGEQTVIRDCCRVFTILARFIADEETGLPVPQYLDGFDVEKQGRRIEETYWALPAKKDAPTPVAPVSTPTSAPTAAPVAPTPVAPVSTPTSAPTAAPVAPTPVAEGENTPF